MLAKNHESRSTEFPNYDFVYILSCTFGICKFKSMYTPAFFFDGMGWARVGKLFRPWEGSGTT